MQNESKVGSIVIGTLSYCHIAQVVADYQSVGNTVISVDTKKKELISDFKNAGQEWQSKGEPEEFVFITSLTMN